MQIVNLSKGALLAKQAKVADSFLKRAKGLLGRKEFLEGEALIFYKTNSIHTFFMRFPIDVLFFENHGRVIKVFSNLRPFRFCSVFSFSSNVVELPAGILSKSATSVGDFIQIKD